MTDIDKAKVGRVGEAVAARFLKEKGYEIIEQNYRKKWGELDIVAKSSDNVLHFVEVKSLKVLPSAFVKAMADYAYAPEANIRLWKKQRMGRAIQTYFIDRKISDDQEFQIDIVAVFLDFERKKAKIRFLENVILT